MEGVLPEILLPPTAEAATQAANAFNAETTVGLIKTLGLNLPDLGFLLKAGIAIGVGFLAAYTGLRIMFGKNPFSKQSALARAA